MREILTRYGRHNIGFLWLFVEPMIFVALHPIVWSLAGSKHGNVSEWGIAVTGFPAFFLCRNMVSRCLGAIKPNTSLLYHQPVKISDIYLSRIILEAAGETMVFVFLAIIATFLGLMPLPYDPLQVVNGWAMLAWLGASLALFVAPISEQVTVIQKLWPALVFIMFFLSSAFYQLASLPPSARDMLLWVPIVSGIEFMREGYFGRVSTFYYDMGYLAMWNVVLTFLGLWQTSLIPRRMTHA